MAGARSPAGSLEGGPLRRVPALRRQNVVAAGLADRVEVQVAYAIAARPFSPLVDTFGTERSAGHDRPPGGELRPAPAAICDHLDLRLLRYRVTAAYGHFGRSEPEFTWERTDKAETLRRQAGLG
jgi:S-adenosylmethionine synthetase